ncbi:cyclic nucleotide-gated ion channel [Ancylobacter terrae]|uniref:cyclic nucleotide-gated ion channel n=1 Tax=Ancylobacter sp. sgz301288 TaxID=3342077 RepID=UPI00385A12F0
MTPPRPGGPRAWRHRVYEVLERDSAGDRVAGRVNALLIGLIIATVALAIVQTVPGFTADDWWLVRPFELVALLAFTLEYGLRVWAAVESPRFRGLAPWRARLRYMLTPAAVVDLVAWFPMVVAVFVEADLRTLALLRLFRFVKLARYSPGMQSLLEVLRAERQSLLACLWLLAGAILIAASAMYLAERRVQPDVFGSIPDAMWWAVATITTVGYGDIVPKSGPGRVIAALTMITGIVMIALPVGIIATAFAEVIKRRDFVVTWGMVARVPLFADLDPAAIGEIHRLLSSHIAERGDVIVRKGDPGRSMYFIASGEVEVDLVERSVTLGEGDFFGELALIHRTRRTATVRAAVRSMLLVLDGVDLEDLMRRRPEIGRRIHAIARRHQAPEPVASRGDIAAAEVGPPMPPVDPPEPPEEDDAPG